MEFDKLVKECDSKKEEIENLKPPETPKAETPIDYQSQVEHFEE